MLGRAGAHAFLEAQGLCCRAQQPEQEGRQRCDEHEDGESPDAAGATALEPFAEVLALRIAETELDTPSLKPL